MDNVRILTTFPEPSDERFYAEINAASVKSLAFFNLMEELTRKDVVNMSGIECRSVVAKCQAHAQYITEK